MNRTEIEFAVRDLVAKPCDPGTFPFDLLKIYNTSPVTIRKLKCGLTNAATRPGDVLWKKKIFFRPAHPGADVGGIGDALAADPLTATHKPRFILVTNGQQVHARDLQFGDTLNTEYERLDETADFLFPLAGYERRAEVEEHPADVNAAKKLKKLYDAILAANPTWSTGHHTHELNLLMTRLLFCFYAEDTGIFDTKKVFTKTLTQYTSEDGSEVAPLLDRLFRIMNVEEGKRPKNIPAVENKFPYVNGSLFEDTVELPQFSRTARRQLLECGNLDWTTINPDIFGSMIQTIAQDGTRSDLGMHYTSVPNIMKVLQPLFLDDLHEVYDKAKDSVPKLEALLGRLSKIRVFDPACGSGNFLIIAYRELRKLEILTLERIGELAPKVPLRLSSISLESFYGIDIVDFASETAKLSLWIAEHQMNAAFECAFGISRPMLPLSNISTIKRANATLIDWSACCPPLPGSETFICGNPPYIGNTYQTPDQKAELAVSCATLGIISKELDYVAAWFARGAEYLKCESDKLAFVSTNSICQGLQVAYLWPAILRRGLEINFCHTAFKWRNNASHNAGVSCVIVGLCKSTKSTKLIYTDNVARSVKSISPYLVSGIPTVIEKAATSISGLPMAWPGSQPRDGGHFIMTPDAVKSLLGDYPNAAQFLKGYCGTKEFLNAVPKSCLWIKDDQLNEALLIPQIAARIEAVRQDRQGRGAHTKAASKHAHRFRHVTHRDEPAILIPGVSSENRRYIPIGLIDRDTVINYAAFAVYSPPPYLLAILSSRLHRLWAEAVGGRLDSRIRYSKELVYNTFPISSLSTEQKTVLAEYSTSIIKARSRYPGKTIAHLYSPQEMPPDLLKAHHENDAYIETAIYGQSFNDDTARLERLFAMYARLKNVSDHNGTFFDEKAQSA